ncbi:MULTISPECIES: thiamine pyrophosphate-binding protein [unclassified Streptomyces]|uniref:thiamine pyrophosphate-binding protein n=1 Tax=unclassified Streptomyces TaxID=2593676 RepID=UPI00224EDE2D|nr:thiamine pyrophosphate-binding protein [Streptomyces sp. NBC_01551]MCX4525958.1 thiamine pyrophosphate-binding protein [Streptomyces sp. NBC_01551]
MTHDHDLVLRPTDAQKAAALAPPPGRTGGDLVVETLRSLGANTVFGLPGQHALALFTAVGRSDLRLVGLRTESSAAFAADAYGRMTGEAVPLLLSTGPGALMSLPALAEAAAASAPVVAISAQVPTAGLGGGRRGHLHELRDQSASFREVVKSVHSARTPSQIPSVIAEAWESALAAPPGPVFVEIPEDVLRAETVIPQVTGVDATPHELAPRPELTAVAAHWLENAARPVIIAGGGVIRSDAAGKLRRLAERVNAPVVTTYGGKGAFPWTHPLSLQSWLEDRHMTDFLEDADVLLVVGSGLGELSSNYHTFFPTGRVIQIEADLGKLESNHAGLGIHADARLALQALLETVSEREDPSAPERVRLLLADIETRLAAQDVALEQQLLTSIRAALPPRSPSFWDMTILSYWAWSAFDAKHPNTMHSAQGAGGLGYAFPAALGAALAEPGTPVLAVSGDGGAMYSIAELATAVQHALDVTWLIVDDGGYGILREYGCATGTDLPGPDFAALAASFDVPATTTTPDSLRADLTKALKTRGPSVVILPTTLKIFTPTHL